MGKLKFFSQFDLTKRIYGKEAFLQMFLGAFFLNEYNYLQRIRK